MTKPQNEYTMKWSERIVMGCLLLFLLLPNLLGVCIATDLLTIGQRAIYLLVSVLFYALGLTVLRRRTFFYVAALSFVFSVVEVVHLVMYQATTSLLFVFTCLKSTKQEFFELCTTYWPAAIVFLLIWGTYFALNRKYVQKEYIAPLKPRMIALVVILLFFEVNIVALRLAPKFRNEFEATQRDMRPTAWAGAEKVCPINFVLHLYHLGDMAYDIRQHNKVLADFRFGIGSVQGNDSTLVVLVIGETSRYDHWQRNGYPRETSPLLCARGKEVVAFDSCYSIANLTTVSVPFMLSPATPESKERYMQEKSVVEAYAEAGYKTAWIADQSFNNHLLQRISATCDYRNYKTIGLSGQDVDTMLWTPLREVLQQEAGRQMIVMHTKGSHFKYSSRYPESFQYFTPDMNGLNISELLSDNVDIDDQTDGLVWRDTKAENMVAYRNLKSTFINSYDNSIRFVDFFLDGVLQQVEQTGRSAVVVYVADHGENLLDDDRNMLMHGTYSGSYYEYHVPLFVWTSEAYRARHPEKVAAMEANREKKLSTMYLFHTLLDLGGIQYAGLDSAYCFDSEKMRVASVVVGLDANMKLKTIPTSPERE